MGNSAMGMLDAAGDVTREYTIEVGLWEIDRCLRVHDGRMVF